MWHNKNISQIHSKINVLEQFICERCIEIYWKVHDSEFLILKKKKKKILEGVFKEVCKEKTIFPKTVCMIKIERNLSCLIPLKSNVNNSKYLATEKSG